jgi:hypothetical protein
MRTIKFSVTPEPQQGNQTSVTTEVVVDSFEEAVEEGEKSAILIFGFLAGWDRGMNEWKEGED